MPVPVMQVGIMRMPMHHRRVAMPMRVWLSQAVTGRMSVLMMRVMAVTVLMLQFLMGMLVLVMLNEMQQESDRH
jgi:hypothetical protein